ncbi:MAG: hypothetical protein H0T51_06775, partial [Pirellulales bacterium]|nr:hypothetical protein [Pirellulales bacterium]
MLGDAQARGWDSTFGKGIVADASPSRVSFDADDTDTSNSGYVSGPTPLSHIVGPIAGTNINSLVGAGTFYANGYTGANAAIA